MFITNHAILRRVCSANFLQSFSNIKKLKFCAVKSFHTLNPFKNEFKTLNNCGLYSQFLEQNFILQNICIKNFSRWSKFPQISATVNQYSRKKPKPKDFKFPEKMKKKFFLTKLRAKRKVAKTIVEIKENILTVPNGLCALRILSTPILGYLVLSEFYTTSLGLFIFAGFTDLIDGLIARTFPSQQTMIGSFLDPAADKLLIATLFITLTVNGLIPIPLTTLIIARDACLFGSGFYIRYVSLPPPKTLSRYFDMSFVTARLSPTAISKMNTFLQLCLVGSSLAAPVFGYVDHLYLHLLWYITGTTTVLSAASYVYYKNSTYKLFVKDSKK